MNRIGIEPNKNRTITVFTAKAAARVISITIMNIGVLFVEKAEYKYTTRRVKNKVGISIRKRGTCIRIIGEDMKRKDAIMAVFLFHSFLDNKKTRTVEKANINALISCTTILASPKTLNIRP